MEQFIPRSFSESVPLSKPHLKTVTFSRLHEATKILRSLAFFELSAYVPQKPTEPKFAFKMKNKTI